MGLPLNPTAPVITQCLGAMFGDHPAFAQLRPAAIAQIEAAAIAQLEAAVMRAKTTLWRQLRPVAIAFLGAMTIVYILSFHTTPAWLLPVACMLSVGSVVYTGHWDMSRALFFLLSNVLVFLARLVAGAALQEQVSVAAMLAACLHRSVIFMPEMKPHLVVPFAAHYFLLEDKTGFQGVVAYVMCTYYYMRALVLDLQVPRRHIVMCLMVVAGMVLVALAASTRGIQGSMDTAVYSVAYILLGIDIFNAFTVWCQSRIARSTSAPAPVALPHAA